MLFTTVFLLLAGYLLYTLLKPVDFTTKQENLASRKSYRLKLRLPLVHHENGKMMKLQQQKHLEYNSEAKSNA